MVEVLLRLIDGEPTERVAILPTTVVDRFSA
jgi:hypothetical protein